MGNSFETLAVTVDEYLNSLKKSPKFGPQVVCHKSFEAVRPQYLPNSRIVTKELQNCLLQIGIKNLYSHQVERLEIIGNTDLIS